MRHHLSRLLPFALTACVSTNKTAVYSRDAALGKRIVAQNPGATPVTSSSCARFILFIPISFIEDSDKISSDMLKQRPGANALVDVTVTGRLLYTFFYNSLCQEVTATPVTL